MSSQEKAQITVKVFTDAFIESVGDKQLFSELFDEYIRQMRYINQRNKREAEYKLKYKFPPLPLAA